MDSINLVPATHEEAEHIAAELRSFNGIRVPSLRFEPIWLAAKDAEGRLVGGVVGEVYLNWLEIGVLWVDEAWRQTGLGGRLLKAAEQAALDKGAESAFLDTFAWQAEGFYRHHGYEEFGRLEDFPVGSARVFLRKTQISKPR
ncbi:MAG TPA: GNAT family N-acetyltransferase [Roseateles sp.]|uniref:GNAT family N-acetyltransferase n=1 Tax=Roseateles sp. TaxID=1971397 RepID=UPI002ED8228C